jgi:hypothetical protein
MSRLKRTLAAQCVSVLQQPANTLTTGQSVPWFIDGLAELVALNDLLPGVARRLLSRILTEIYAARGCEGA